MIRKLFNRKRSYLEINEKNFPDELFREYIYEMFDRNKDGMLSHKEIAKVKDIDISFSKGILSLQGIENFPKLKRLDCGENLQLTRLDISKNPILQYLSCHNTGITELDVSNNLDLRVLDCRDTGVTELDVSKNTALTFLRCSETRITELDVSKNPKLESLDCSHTGITVLNLRRNQRLYKLMCFNKEVTRIYMGYNLRFKADVNENVKLFR